MKNFMIFVRIAAVCFGIVWLWTVFASPGKPVELSTMFTKEEQYEVDKLKSLWYWLYSEHKTDAYEDRYNVIRLSLWVEQMRDVETKLKAFGVCIEKSKYSYDHKWVECPRTQEVVHAE